MQMKRFQSVMIAAMLAITVSGCGGCYGINTLGLHLFSMKIEVRGANHAPLVGAVVSCSSGETVTVDTSGIVKLNFSDVGPYYIVVRYQNDVVASYNVSMPGDGGKTLTANYVSPAAPSGGNGAAMSGGSNAFAMMGARLYPILFQYVFNAYGYSLDLSAYKQGQYTEWQVTSDGEKKYSTRKAFLSKLANGQEWWQVNFVSSDDNDSMMMEVLFSDKHESIRRMRQKFGNETPKEVPVTEGWYTSPMQLTPESIEGSVVKKGVSVSVPAGKFTCDQLEFGVAPNMTLRLYRNIAVPGGVVKYEMVGEDKEVYSGELTAFGSGATTKLGSY
jgi:hypothetical protein